ncbi:MAG: UDP-N-acetylmuramoyl-L-alanyl-D-glutamate--2,6-diaminopimelate ligase [Flavobacteriales bacterium]|jgi:UDP-N-acetylmuramoyl-L-alanyl-D-glutamate--2,6-diaminopimelate ligase|nr:UDP-N-acetylmuramoyl-L-alanyl-D-glutamate--2,6-diaminopimelate ligase [Flavobacteriales bacterium]
MKLLQEILYGTRIQETTGNTHVAIEDVAFDSRKVKAFSLFVAVPGTQVDGHDYIDQAIDSGAVAIIAERMPENRKEGITYVRVHDTGASLGPIAASFYGHPSESMKVVAITGTNGKTTTVSLLYQLFRSMDRKVGMLSTIENRILDQAIVATHTTPDALQMQQLFRKMADAGCKYVFMEASSHSIHQHRLAGTKLTGALFTNITHEHLDYHNDFNAYIAAKKGLFDMLPADAFALTNQDDSHGADMTHDCKAKTLDYALTSMADYRGKIVENQLAGLHLHLEGHDLYSKLIGSFNAYNLLAVYAVARELGMEPLEVLTHISLLNPPAGRFQQVEAPDGVTAVVDFAHTPDALDNVLKTIDSFRTGSTQVITVVGCGGNRDKTKRPIMARVAASWSDRVFLTSDNPRREEPDSIIADMKAGLDPIDARKCIAIADRREAIRMAAQLATSGDILLVAGKGHEAYQEIQGVRHDFDDCLELRNAFKTA